jgi:hypothetical protein
MTRRAAPRASAPATDRTAGRRDLDTTAGPSHHATMLARVKMTRTIGTISMISRINTKKQRFFGL